MNFIREEIRAIIKEILSDELILEAVPSEHFNDRVFQRLTSSMYTRPNFDYSEVRSQIETVKAINFNPRDSFAIFLKRFPVTFVSKDPETGNPSVGDELWAVVRNNEITTIFFRNSFQKDTKVKGVDYTLNVKNLIKYYNENEKNVDGTVDFGVGTYQKSGVGTKKRVQLELPIVDLGGANWYVDEANEQIIYAKNIKKTLQFNDLKEDYLEKVINAVVQ